MRHELPTERSAGARARMNVSIKAWRSRRVMTFGLAAQQPPATPPMHAQRRAPPRDPERDGDLRQRQAALGPVDIVVQDGLIAYIGPHDGMPSRRRRFRRRRDRRTP